MVDFQYKAVIILTILETDITCFYFHIDSPVGNKHESNNMSPEHIAKKPKISVEVPGPTINSITRTSQRSPVITCKVIPYSVSSGKYYM